MSRNDLQSMTEQWRDRLLLEERVLHLGPTPANRVADYVMCRLLEMEGELCQRESS